MNLCAKQWLIISIKKRKKKKKKKKKKEKEQQQLPTTRPMCFTASKKVPIESERSDTHGSIFGDLDHHFHALARLPAPPPGASGAPFELRDDERRNEPWKVSPACRKQYFTPPTRPS